MIASSVGKLAAGSELVIGDALDGDTFAHLIAPVTSSIRVIEAPEIRARSEHPPGGHYP